MDFGKDIWKLKEEKLPKQYALSETLFAQGNGYIGIRGSFEEGTPDSYGDHVSGTYLNGFYESAVIRYPEIAYGFPEKSQTMLNVTSAQDFMVYADGKRVWACSEATGGYYRYLDLKRGLVTRGYDWEMGAVSYTSSRIVSFTHQNICAVRVEITPGGWGQKLEIHSILDGGVRNQECGDDPRTGSGLIGKVLETEELFVKEHLACMRQRTKDSGLHVACAVLVTAEGGSLNRRAVTDEEKASFIITTDSSDSKIIITKYIAYQDSRYCETEHLTAQVEEMAREAEQIGWEELCREQEAYLSKFWDRSSVSVEGDAYLTQGLNYNLYSLLQSAGRDGRCNIGAKGLTGEGYEGHYFWDTEAYLMPVFIYTCPEVARELLVYRYSILEQARACARACGHERGILFPWRTIDGRECSTYFLAGTAQYHINADVALAVFRYFDATEDMDFMERYGAEILFETAEFWLDIGFYNENKGKRFCIDCATGPDEYTVMNNNNLYTNVMAGFNLRFAAEIYTEMEKNSPGVLERLRQKMGLTESAWQQWKRAAEQMYLPYDEQNGLYLQDDGFYDRKPWDFEHVPKENYPLLLHYHPLYIYRHRVCKQADTVLAMLQQPELFTAKEKENAYDVYNRITTHDSSLSKSVFGILAAEIGRTEEAYEFLADSIRADLDNMHGNTQDGLHMANMAGSWLGLVQGFGGMRTERGTLGFHPTLPSAWSGYHITVNYRGCRLRLEVTDQEVTYRWLEGKGIHIFHRDTPVTLSREHMEYKEEWRDE